MAEPSHCDTFDALRSWRPKRYCFVTRWEADRPGCDLVAGGFVRILAAARVGRPGTEPVGKIDSYHGSGHWAVDLGADDDKLYCVPTAHLHRIFVDLAVPSVFHRCMALRGGPRTCERQGRAAAPRQA